METVFLVCATLGGTLMVGQLLLGMFGLGGHHDAGGDHDASGLDGHDAADGHDAHDGHDGHAEAHHESGHSASSWFIGVLTLRTIVAAVTFFGLAGMVGVSRGLETVQTLAVATAAGLAALFLVAYLMRGLYRLKADGTVRISRAVGLDGTVYLRIPGRRSGVGKVHLNLQNRTVEYQAVTAEDELPTGAKVFVVSVVGTDTVEVASMSPMGK